MRYGRVASFAPADEQEFAQLFADDAVTLMQMAVHYKVSVTCIRNYAHKLGLKRKTATGGLRKGEQYFPTPAEIEAACQRIRSSWPIERFRGDLA